MDNKETRNFWKQVQPDHTQQQSKLSIKQFKKYCLHKISEIRKTPITKEVKHIWNNGSTNPNYEKKH
jgi:hypothetical protein